MLIQKIKATIIASIVGGLFVFGIYHTWAGMNTDNKKEINLEKNIDKTVDCKDTRDKLQLPIWWRLNEQCRSQKYIRINPIYTSREERVKELFHGFGYNTGQVNELWDIYRSAGRIERIRGEFLVCIAYADSSLGKALLTKNNPGNIGNNDRGDKVGFETIEKGVYAIAKTLNNKYLGNKNTLIELSLHEMTKANRPVDKFYASGRNWAMNVENCLSMIHNKDVGLDFNYRF